MFHFGSDLTKVTKSLYFAKDCDFAPFFLNIWARVKNFPRLSQIDKSVKIKEALKRSKEKCYFKIMFIPIRSGFFRPSFTCLTLSTYVIMNSCSNRPCRVKVFLGRSTKETNQKYMDAAYILYISLGVFICMVRPNQGFSSCSRQKSLDRTKQISKKISIVLC